MQNRKLEYKQHVMEKEVADMQEAFDGALAVLRREKLHLEADVKAAQIKRLTYQQELQLLKVGHCGTQGKTICLVKNQARSGEADVKAARVRRLTHQQELQPRELGHCSIKCNTGIKTLARPGGCCAGTPNYEAHSFV